MLAPFLNLLVVTDVLTGRAVVKFEAVLVAAVNALLDELDCSFPVRLTVADVAFKRSAVILSSRADMSASPCASKALPLPFWLIDPVDEVLLGAT